MCILFWELGADEPTGQATAEAAAMPIRDRPIDQLDGAASQHSEGCRPDFIDGGAVDPNLGPQTADPRQPR
jgi:hypothetical protein